MDPHRASELPQRVRKKNIGLIYAMVADNVKNRTRSFRVVFCFSCRTRSSARRKPKCNERSNRRHRVALQACSAKCVDQTNDAQQVENKAVCMITGTNVFIHLLLKTRVRTHMLHYKLVVQWVGSNTLLRSFSLIFAFHSRFLSCGDHDFACECNNQVIRQQHCTTSL